MKRVKLPCHRSVVTSELILNATFGSMSETTHGQVIFLFQKPDLYLVAL